MCGGRWDFKSLPVQLVFPLLSERHLKVIEHMYVVACKSTVVFSVQAVVSFSLLCLATVAFCLKFILFYMEPFYKMLLYLCPFISPGDGGHGYLRDWLWWAGLLTSKYDYLPRPGLVSDKIFNLDDY